MLQLIDAFTYCVMIDTNVMELVLDNRQTDGWTDSLVDPSSTAIPFATYAQAVAGEMGTNSKKRLKGITDCQDGKDRCNEE